MYMSAPRAAIGNAARCSFVTGCAMTTSDRAAYNSLKNQLAQEDWPDMNAYAEAKGPLITEITARAKKWARRSGWTV